MSNKTKGANKRNNKKSETSNVEVVETKTVETVETPTETVLDVPQDLTETPTESDETESQETPAVLTEGETIPEGMRKCNQCGIPKDSINGFSPLQSGRVNNTCKSCRTLSSLEWTEKRADYRKVYHEAIRLQNHGIPAITPSAATWKEGDMLLTTEGNGYAAGLDARKIWEDIKQARKDKSAADKLAAQELADKIKAENKAKRDKERAEKQAKREAEAETRKAEREAEKQRKIAERLEQAKKLDAERQAKKDEKAAERVKQAAERAEKAEADRLAKEAEKAEKARQRAEAAGSASA